MFSRVFRGSPNRARTCDIMINSHALYRLSYRGIWRSSQNELPFFCFPLATFPISMNQVRTTDWAMEENMKPDRWDRAYCVGFDLSSRTASRRVFSAPHSLTSVFGMGTGGPYALWALTVTASFAGCVVHLQGFEPWTHWLRVSCSTSWAKGTYFLFGVFTGYEFSLQNIH